MPPPESFEKWLLRWWLKCSDTQPDEQSPAPPPAQGWTLEVADDFDRNPEGSEDCT